MARTSGKRLSAQEIAAWDISILPDGGNLPPGSGNAEQGARAYAQKCVACHGESGKGGIAAALVGSAPITTISGAQKTIANFWPYPTTVFDFIRRAMPWQQPKSLTDDEVYALTGLHIRAQQADRRRRDDERRDAAESPDAEPRRLHRALSGEDVAAARARALSSGRCTPRKSRGEQHLAAPSSGRSQA
jgi:cytochrome c